MSIMYRSFNAVGQGAFYTETFRGKEDKHIVYDCGSLKNITLIESAIESTFAKDESISAVFISHLDEDHINGLEHLLKYCSVKTLFLPLMQECDKALLLMNLMSSGISKYSFLYAFIANPEAIAGEQTRIVYVEEFNNESHPHEERQDFFPIDDEGDYKSTYRRSISSGVPCGIGGFDWVYVPFNYKQTERRDQLIASLNKYEIPIPKTPSEVPELYQRYSVELKSLYSSTSITGDINTNSMVVYSGPPSHSTNAYFINCHVLYCDCKFLRCCDCGYGKYHEHKARWCDRYGLHKVGCLYTGDYDASGADKWKKLERGFGRYWDLIGTWQIPHHGAKSSYNPKIAKPYAHTAVISAGSTNQFGHPHESVIRDLLLGGVNLFVVTEKRDSQARFLIRLD